MWWDNSWFIHQDNVPVHSVLLFRVICQKWNDFSLSLPTSQIWLPATFTYFWKWNQCWKNFVLMTKSNFPRLLCKMQTLLGKACKKEGIWRGQLPISLVILWVDLVLNHECLIFASSSNLLHFIEIDKNSPFHTFPLDRLNYVTFHHWRIQTILHITKINVPPCLYHFLYLHNLRK